MRIEVPRAMYSGQFREVNDHVIAEYRANAGRLETAFTGAPILLLNHRGAKTAAPYTSPLAFSRRGDDYVIVASMGDERARLYRAHADEISNFDDYQARTTREIPLVVLEPRQHP